MHNSIKTFLIIGVAALIPAYSIADLFYDPERSAQLTNLVPADSIRQTSEYICGESALYISTYAATNDINGKLASVSGKIVSGSQSHDISKDLTKAVKGDDLIYRSMSVRCGQNSGAFKVVFSLGKYFTDRQDSRVDSTSIEIYSDGFVIGSRSMKRQLKTNKN